MPAMVARAGSPAQGASGDRSYHRLHVSGGRGTVGPALRIFLWSRAAIWLLAAATAVLFAGQLNPARGEWDSVRLHELGDAIDVWARWDSDWYLRIASDGYSWPSSTPAFFPLYPLLVATLGRVLLGHELLAGVLLSLAAAGVGFALLYRLGAQRLGPAAARRAVVVLALFPTSLFLGAVYSEALFLALAVAVFLLAERGRLGSAAVLTGLALLTRPQGLALLPVLALFAWRSGRRRDLALLAVPLALLAAYPLALWLWIDRPFAFLRAQEVWDRDLSPLGPLGGIAAALGDASLVDGDTVALAFAAVMVPLAVLAWRRLGAAYGLYASVALALPMSFPSERLGGLYSFPRLCIVAFPCFLAAGSLSLAGRTRFLAAAALSALLAVNVVRWALWYWVA